MDIHPSWSAMVESFVKKRLPLASRAEFRPMLEAPETQDGMHSFHKDGREGFVGTRLNVHVQNTGSVVYWNLDPLSFKSPVMDVEIAPLLSDSYAEAMLKWEHSAATYNKSHGVLLDMMKMIEAPPLSLRGLTLEQTVQFSAQTWVGVWMIKVGELYAHSLV